MTIPLSTARDDGSASSRATGRYWGRFADGNGKWIKSRPPGEDLAALRRGTGRKPGSVPEMWKHYTQLGADGPLVGLEAEHVALTLYAAHQQSKDKSMHRRGVGLGAAVRVLRQSQKFSEEAVDRRFTATATATSMQELGMHLRGLITQLRSIDQPLDYDQLERDLRRWEYSDGVALVRRQWGKDYFLRPRAESEGEASNAATAAPSTPT